MPAKSKAKSFVVTFTGTHNVLASSDEDAEQSIADCLKRAGLDAEISSEEEHEHDHLGGDSTED